MTREDRITALIAAHKQSRNGKLTFVLLSADNITITQNEQEAKTLVRKNGYRVYAKCKDDCLIL